jgi:hypothetical protein
VTCIADPSASPNCIEGPAASRNLRKTLLTHAYQSRMHLVVEKEILFLSLKVALTVLAIYLLTIAAQDYRVVSKEKQPKGIRVPFVRKPRKRLGATSDPPEAASSI